MTTPIPFVGPLEEGTVPRVNSQRCINLVPQVEGQGAGAPVTLRAAPGLKPYIVAGAAGSGCRPGSGVIFQNNSYWVFGDEVVKVDLAGNKTQIGLLDTTGGNVSIAYNHLEMCIVDGSNNVYSYVPNNATPWVKTALAAPFIATDPTDDGQVYPTSIAMKDFYFAINRTQGGTTRKGNFYLSALNDGRTFTGASFTNAEANPDAIIGLESTANDLICFGDFSIQHYFNVGSTAFPFDPARGRDIGWGLAAAAGKTKIEDTVYFLGQTKGNLKFVKHPGGVISNIDIDNQLARMSTTDDCRAFAYSQDGHFQVQFTFPSEDKTWVYDLHSENFYEKQSYGYGRHLATAALKFGGKLLVGIEGSGNLYEWDYATYNDDGDMIYRERRAPIAADPSGKEVSCTHLRIIMDAGLGSIAGEDPQVMLDYSIDGGITFINEQQAGIGKQGERTTTVDFYSLGSSNCGFIFRVRMTDEAPWVIMGAVASFEQGDW